MLEMGGEGVSLVGKRVRIDVSVIVMTKKGRKREMVRGEAASTMVLLS